MSNVKEIIKDLEEIRQIKGDKYIIDNFEDTVLKSKNPYLSYYFIDTLRINYIEKHIESIINSKDNKLIYDTIPLGNVDLQTRDELINAIIDSKDAYYCYLIAYNYFKENSSVLLEQVVLEAKNPELSYKYALNIKRANIKKHEQIVLDSDSAKWCYKFAKDIKGANVKALELVVFNSNNLEFITLFALEVKGSDVKALATKVLKSKDPRLNYIFASRVTGADIINHGNAVIESKNIEYIYRFALDVKDANVEKLRNTLVEIASKDDLNAIFNDEDFDEKYQNSIIKNKILSLRKGI